MSQIIKSHTFISVNELTKAIIKCGNEKDKDITLTDLFVLNPRCTLRTKEHTFINPTHYNHNNTLKLSETQYYHEYRHEP